MNRKLLFIILTVLLIISASLVFYMTAVAIGKEKGYLIGMAFYWFFWCLGVPVLVKRKSIIYFLKNERSLFIKNNWWVIILFFSTIIIPIFMYNTISYLLIKPLVLFLIAIPVAIISGTCEELFWRGLFIKEFPDSIAWGIIIPSLFFSLFHFAPQLAIPHPNKVLFVLLTFPLGLTNGIIAYKTKSAKWSAVSHSIGGIMAFGGPAALCLYRLLYK